MTVRRLAVVLVAAAVVTGVWVLLPPAARRLEPPGDPRTLRGAFHVHTVRSDGTGTPDAVAVAAARAGLDFVILTDHGDATRMPEAPRYLRGVLIIDAVEISTTGGHYVALGLEQSPYRLAGEPRDVIEDVHRLGGFGIAAHPASPKDDLRWREWQAPIDGLEWLNADSQWRDESRRALARAFLTYWLRGPETIAALFDRPEVTLARWDAAARRRPVVAVAGLDVHARLPLNGQAEAGEGRRSLPVPSYEAAFRTLAIRVRVDAPPGRTAASASDDAARIQDAIRHGRTYSVIDALAGPATLDLSAAGPGTRASMGGEVADAGAVAIRAQLKPDVAGATIVLLRDGVETATAATSHLEFVHPASAGPAVYRAEVRLDGAPGTPPVPWIVANPIYVTRGLPRSTVPPPRPVAREHVVYPGSPDGWGIERHAESDGKVVEAPDLDGHLALQFTWRLAAGIRRGQYAAMVHAIDGRALEAFDQVALTASASRPMRASVQIRVPSGSGLRWSRSIYLDPHARDIVIPVREMTPIEAPAGAPLDLARADSWLLVVDTVNTVPGTGGTIRVSRVAWQETAGR
jgi:hypothetical protein